MLQRFSEPHKFDMAPKGTRLRVDHGETFDVYIQISDNEEQPKWQLIDTFTEESYQFYLQSGSLDNA